MKKFKIFFLTTIIAFASIFLGINGAFSPRENYTPLTLGANIEQSVAHDDLVEVIDLNNVCATPQDSTYTLLDSIEINVKNQLQYNICYTCASLTMVETYISKEYQEYYEFSPMHFATFSYINHGNLYSGNGGSIYDFMEYISTYSGPVLEEEMPLESGLSGKEESQKAFYLNSEFTKLVTINKLVNFLDEESLSDSSKLTNRKAMKSHIQNYGSLIANIDAEENSLKTSNIAYDSTNSRYYLKKASSISDHMVSIIGWDDNYQVSNYDNAGAWLCQNSWGEDNYTYFYVSYDDETITDSVYGVIDATLTTPNNMYSNAIKNDWNYASVSTSNINFTSFYSILDVESLNGKWVNKIYLPFSASQNSNSSISLAFTDSLTFSSIDGSLYADFSGLSFGSPLYPENAFSQVVGGKAYGISTLKFDSDFQVSKKYIVIMYQIYNVYGISGFMYSNGITNEENAMLNTYSRLSNSSLSGTWTISDGSASHSYIFDIRLLYSSSQGEENIMSSFSTTRDYLENDKVIKNITYLGNELSFNVFNASEPLADSSVVIYTSYKNSNSITKTDMSESFNIKLENLEDNDYKVIIEPKTALKATDYPYIIKLVINGKSYYKSFNISDTVVSYQISYNLNGGTNNIKNLSGYEHDLKTIKVYNPSKTGYTFKEWKINGATLTSSNNDYIELSLSNVDVDLEAVWELDTPIISISPTPSTSHEITFAYDGKAHQISIDATHGLSEQIAYCWYYSLTNDSFDELPASLNGKTKTISLTNVDQSYYLYCKATITIDGETKSATSDVIHVVITPQVCEVYWGPAEANSNWNSDTKSFNYDGKTHTITLIGADKYPALFVDNIAQNSFKDAGDYIASATINLTSTNYTISDDLKSFQWHINKETITVKIKNISLNSKTDFDAFSDYQFEVLGTNYDNFNFNWKFELVETGNEALKTIRLKSYNSHKNYKVESINGNLKLINYELNSKCNDYEITLRNENGYIMGTTIKTVNIEKSKLSSENQKYFDKKDLIVYDIIDISISDTTVSDINTISIKLKSALKDKKVKVYLLKDGNLELIDSKNDGNLLTFTTAKLGEFIIVEAPETVDTASMVIGIIIVFIFGLMCCVVIRIIKKHREKKYISNSTIAH